MPIQSANTVSMEELCYRHRKRRCSGCSVRFAAPRCCVRSYRQQGRHEDRIPELWRGGGALEYTPIGEDGQSGKLWISDIGETVFDEIAYAKGTEDLARHVTLDEETGVITADEGYKIATSGRENQKVTFSVDATYYSEDAVLFVENFEGDAPKFQGVYGDKANGDYQDKKGQPVELPVVDDPTKARAGGHALTQGAKGSQSEGVYARYSEELTGNVWATMWYYDDGSDVSAVQNAFMGGVITQNWTQGAFNGTMGVAQQPDGKTVVGEYASRGDGGTWVSTGVKRTEGWHKFCWMIGENNTEMYVDGTKLSNTGTASQSNFGGFHITFNWNNQSVPVQNKHYIDSFSIVKADESGDPVEATETLTEEITLYVIDESESLSLTYTQDADNLKGKLEIANADTIGATITDTRFSTQDNIDGILTLNETSGEITAETGYILSNKNNPLAKKVTFEADVEYYIDDPDQVETFHGTVDVYYDIDESQSEDKPLTGTGERKIIDLNGKWSFGGAGVADASAMNYDDSSWSTVTVPHDWNAETGYGGNARLNGAYWYRKTLDLSAEDAAAYNLRSAFLEFGSVGMEAHVYLNGEEVGSHKGGWSAFNVDVTGKFREGENVIAVSANNERTLNGDIAPLHGDFDNASGINRDVQLVLTSQVHLDELDNGSDGVYMIPQRADDWTGSNGKWEVDVTAMIRNDTARSRNVTVKATVSHPTSFDDVLGLGAKGLLRFDPEDMYDINGGIVGTQTQTISATRGSATPAELTVEVTNPKLWDGLESPYQYVATIEVYEGDDASGTLLDSYETMIGFRYYDAVRTSGSYGAEGDGFYLNGRLYPLRGMAMHEDWPGMGRALPDEFIEKDIAVLYEMGANWTRVSHYPHDEYCYDLLSRYGIACSAEIPLVDGVSLVDANGNPTTSKTTGKLSPGFKETTLDQFDDMVKQLYNYPAILGWLMQNELGGGTYGQGTGADATAAQAEMITALNDRSHELDPGRKTVMAMSLSNCYKFDADWLLWNGYPGWYGTGTTGIGYFVDGYAAANDESHDRPTGVSEYGAGSNPYHQAEYIRGETDYTKWYGTGAAFHPESYANDRHEQSLREINARPFYWATAGWIMFDFSASSRNEGGRQGTNDKGLVYKARPEEIEGYSGDPEELLLRKDVFYLYKANWDKEHPLTYIAERRFVDREQRDTTVTVYSNADSVTLSLNGTPVGTMQATQIGSYVDRNTLADETASGIFKFKVKLEDMDNEIVAVGYDRFGDKVSEDTVTWQFNDIGALDIASDTFAVMNESKTIFLTGKGDASETSKLFRPADGVSPHKYQVLTADRQPVNEGEIQAGMLLEVAFDEYKRTYTFQQPYISAMKKATVDGSASAAEAVDFQEDTVWTAGDTEAHEIVVDLGKKFVLTELKVNWANAGEASRYTVETSTDGKVWNQVADQSGNTVASGAVQNELQSYGRYVKLCIAEGSTPSISEIEVYGWMVSVKRGENRIFVSETERTICVPTDVAEFHTGGVLSGGMSFENIAPLIVVEGNCQAVHENDTDYSLDENHSLFNVTDTLGRKVSFRFKFFTGGTKPEGPFELAMGKPATASSLEKDIHVATNATTEDDSRWSSKGQGTSGLDEWVMADLGSECVLDSIRLEFPRKGVGVSSDRYYTYEVYLGNSIEEAFSSEMVIDGTKNTDINGIFEFTNEVAGKTARYVRVKVTGNSSNWQVGLNRLYVKGYAIVLPHVHEWSEEWSMDDTHHWKMCNAEGCDIVDPAAMEGYGEHTAGGVCSICGYDGTDPDGEYTVTVYFGSASRSKANEGDPVMITADTRSGYVFDRWIVEKGGMQLSDATSSRAAFLMPAQDVVIRASYTSTGGSGNKPSGGGSGIVSATPKTEYDLPSGRIPVSNGSYRVSPSKAQRGDKVTIAVTPEDGYEVERVTVTEEDGAAVSVTAESDLLYSFRMPDGEVEIEVEFRQIAASAGVPTIPAAGFTDVAGSDWFKAAVDYVSAKGMMTGNRGQFTPYENLTRGMIAQILFNLEGDGGAYQHAFPDVTGSDWFEGAVAWVSAKGVMSGYSSGLFGANDFVTREQLALTLFQYAKLKGYDLSASAGLDAFADGAEVSSWASPAMQWAVAQGLFSGKSNGRLDPQGTATRAEVAAVLMNFCENIAK